MSLLVDSGILLGTHCIGTAFFLDDVVDIVWLTFIVSLRFGSAASVSNIGFYESDNNNIVIILYNQRYLSEKFVGYQDGRIYPMF